MKSKSKDPNNSLDMNDKTYQMTKFLGFKSPKTEKKYQEESLYRKGYIIQCFLVLQLFGLVLKQVTGFLPSSNEPEIIQIFSLFTMFSIIICSLLLTKHNFLFLLQTLITLNIYYFNLVFLYQFDYSTQLLLAQLHLFIGNMLIFNTWKHHILINLIHFILQTLWVYFYQINQKSHKNIQDFGLHVLLLSLLFNIVGAFIEKQQRDFWILLKTYKVSERTLRNIFDSIEQPIFIVSLDTKRQILTANKKASIIFNETSINLMIGTSILDLFDQEYHTTIENIFQHKDSHTKEAFPLKSYEGNLLDNNLSQSQSFNQIIWVKLQVSSLVWRSKNSLLVELKLVTKEMEQLTFLNKLISKAKKYCDHDLQLNQKNFYKWSTLKDNNVIDKQTFKRFISNIVTSYQMRNNILRVQNMIDNLIKVEKTQLSIFNIRECITFNVEVAYSILSKSNEFQLSLKFEESFQYAVKADLENFCEFFLDAILSLYAFSDKTSMEIYCGLSSVLDNRQLELGLNFDFVAKDSDVIDTLRKLLEQESNDISTVDQDSELTWFLVSRYIQKVNGKYEITPKFNERYFVTIKLPFTLSSEDKKNRGRFENQFEIYDMQLTVSRLQQDKHRFIWKKP